MKLYRSTISRINRKHITEYYQDSVEELRRVFYRLDLIMIGEAAIRFIDQAVFAICLPLWDADKDGFISVAEAKKIQRFAQGVFNNVSDITSLDDLDKFVNGYIYHAGNFSNMPNLITASTGLKINLTSGLPDNFTAGYGNCPKLERLKINSVITEISNSSFENDVSLKTIEWGGNETKIGKSAFKGCTAIEEVSLPTSVTYLGGESFRNCSSLRNINLGNLKNLEYTSFSGCTNLMIDVDMPLLESVLNSTFGSSGIISASFGKITEAGYFSLANCPNLRYVILPNTLTIIGNSCFSGSKALEYIVCHAATPPILDGSAFGGGVSCLIYVPDASVNAYKSATNWSNIASRIRPISEKP